MNLLAEKADKLIEEGIEAQKNGRYSVALTLYQKSITLYPTGQAYTLIGIIHFEQANYHKALTNFDEASRLDPFGDLSYWGRAKCHVALGDYSWAVSQFDRAILLAEPNVPDEYYVDRDKAQQKISAK